MLYDVEEDYELFVAPQIGEYSSKKGGASRHLMVNGSSERIAIKIKCSNNNAYRVSPVYTIIEPGFSQRLQVVRDPGEPQVDKLILLYKKTECKNAHEAFYESGEPRNENKRTMIALVTHDRPELLPKPPQPKPTNKPANLTNIYTQRIHRYKPK
uniref:Major sperm protein n=1 Tax=Acrobeloides nanus TaxID=290746 RepID=A0A914EP99_9BILA